MTRRTADRPLTDAEERALIQLADDRDSYEAMKARGAKYLGDGYTSGRARNCTTLYNLRKRGLVDIRERPSATVARITDEGYQLVRSTGD